MFKQIVFIILLFVTACHNKDILKASEQETGQKKYIHFSIDDCSIIFKNITEYKYKSIFDEPILKRLKELHDKYGLKVCLYVFYDFDGFCLKDVSNEYTQEWEKNSNWLKVALHSYSPQKLSDSIISYSYMTENLERITSKESITNTVRLERYQGSLDDLSQKDTPSCLLTADNIDVHPTSYYLNPKENALIDKNEYLEDSVNGKTFFKTDFRLDNPDDFEQLFNTNSHEQCIIFFTHEWLLESKLRLNIFAMLKQKYTANKIWNNLESVCIFMNMFEHEYITDLNEIKWK